MHYPFSIGEGFWTGLELAQKFFKVETYGDREVLNLFQEPKVEVS
jgi:hypothetical protein